MGEDPGKAHIRSSGIEVPPSVTATHAATADPLSVSTPTTSCGCSQDASLRLNCFNFVVSIGSFWPGGVVGDVSLLSFNVSVAWARQKQMTFATKQNTRPHKNIEILDPE